MHISVMVYSFRAALERGEIDLPRLIQRLRELDVAHVELMDSLMGEQEDAVRKALAETELSVPCYDLVCDVAIHDRAERTKRLARFRQRLTQAAAFGARLVLVVPGLPGAGIDPWMTRQWFCEALQACLPDAARLGITLTIENLGILADLYGRSEHILAICDAVGPELKVTFDAGNFLLAGEDNVAALDRLAPRVAHVHFKDWKVVPPGTACAYPGVDGRLYQGTALGDGIANLRGVLGRLQDLCYGGAISVEYEGPGEPDAAVCRGLAHVRALLGGSQSKSSL